MSQLLEHKCPGCGASVEFNTKEQNMKCPYCDTEFDVEALDGLDEELKTKDDRMEWSKTDATIGDEEAEGINIFICNSCGGEVVGNDVTAATFCPFCDNPVVMKSRFAGELKPDYVIPFKLDRQAAKKAYLKHLSGKRLLPKVFKDENHIDEIKGIYVPFWLFSATADADITYKGTKTRFWSDSNYNYTVTSHYAIRRAGKLGFRNVPVDGSVRMDNDLMESLEPFDFSEAVDFKTAYLSGFLADRYDVSSEESSVRANERIKASTESEFRQTVHGYATLITQSSGVSLDDAQARYALYPVWILNTTWRDKKYVFAMNGQTGKFVGNLPIDPGAWAKWFALFAGIFTAAAVLIMHLLT